MEEREIDKIIKPQKKLGLLVVLFIIFLSIAIVCIGLVFYERYEERKESIDLSEVIFSGTEEEGEYVQINIAYFPKVLATNLDKDYYLYYIEDEENHIYIAKLSNKTFEYLNSIANKENGKLSEPYQLKGFTYKIDSQIEKLVLASKMPVSIDKVVTEDNISEIFGEVYIYENKSPKSEREITLYKISALVGVFFLILSFGYILPSIIKARKVLNNEELVDELRSELEVLTDNPYKKQQLYLTRNYIISGVQVIKYKDIVWGYILEETKYGMKIGENLIIHTKDNKKHIIGSVVGKNNDILNQVLEDIKTKNESMRVGYNKENKEFFKNYKKTE